MKAFITAALLTLIIGNIRALDTESYQFIDYLRAISAPGKPEIYEDSVIFTASSSYQRVGISFAHEAYAKVHWFKRLMIPADMAELTAAHKNRKDIEPNKDSGIMFYAESIPDGMKNMDYRLIIDGLWMADPLNPLTVTSPSGVVESRIPLPATAAQASCNAVVEGANSAAKLGSLDGTGGVPLMRGSEKAQPASPPMTTTRLRTIPMSFRMV